MKSQRKERKYFSTSQTRLLTETFNQKPYVSLEEKQALAVRLQTSLTRIRMWFCHHRFRIRKQKVDAKGNQLLEHKGEVLYALELLYDIRILLCLLL